MTHSTAAPVFIIGGTRRERDLLRAVIEPDGGLSFAPENDTLAAAAAAVAHDWPTLVLDGYPEQRWYKAAADAYAARRTAQAAADGKRRWVECLGAAALGLGTIDRLYPTAQVIHLVSGNPLDLAVRSTRRAARALSAGRYSEVSVRHLRAYPAVVRRTVLDQIGSPSPQQPQECLAA